MTEREALLKKISTYQFAAYDLQLYLDTHPDDSDTLAQVRRYRELLKPLISLTRSSIAHRPFSEQ